MSRKEYMTTILENLEKHNDIIPAHLQTLLMEVKQHLQHVSAQAFYQQTDGVVTQPAQNQQPDSEAPMLRLQEAFLELRDLADHHDDTRPDLKSAVDQLQGLLGTSGTYFPE